MDFGDQVVYVDERGKEHNALVTAVWGNDPTTSSVNLVFVVADDSKTDQYGRQIQRETSVVPEINQAAHGRMWKMP